MANSMVGVDSTTKLWEDSDTSSSIGTGGDWLRLLRLVETVRLELLDYTVNPHDYKLLQIYLNGFFFNLLFQL